MGSKGKSFSIVRLNNDPTGWGVVDDGSGALVHVDGLALRLTKERAKEISAKLNDEVKERGSATSSAAATASSDKITNLEPDPL